MAFQHGKLLHHLWVHHYAVLNYNNKDKYKSNTYFFNSKENGYLSSISKLEALFLNLCFSLAIKLFCLASSSIKLQNPYSLQQHCLIQLLNIDG